MAQNLLIPVQADGGILWPVLFSRATDRHASHPGQLGATIAVRKVDMARMWLLVIVAVIALLNGSTEAQEPYKGKPYHLVNRWAATAGRLIDANTASKETLMRLPGIGDAEAQRIIDARPLQSKRDLLDREIVSADTYNQIRNKLVVMVPAPGQTPLQTPQR